MKIEPFLGLLLPLTDRVIRLKIIFFFKGRGCIRPQIGPLAFLKIFVLEMIYSGRSRHSEPSYAILYRLVEKF